MASPKMYFIVDDAPHGPVAQSMVQRMIRDGDLAEDCFVWREGMSDWQPARDVLARLATKDQKDGLRALGLSVTRGLTLEEADNQIGQVTAQDPEKARLWNDWSIRRRKKNEIIQYCASQRPPIRISTFFLEEILEQQQARDPTTFQQTDPQRLVDLLNQQHPIHTWRDDPATEPQLRLLASNGVSTNPNLTKGEASDMIEALLHGPTEGQKRRLAYYGIGSAGITKDKATELIDEYVATHPDAEYGYQLWKAKNLRDHRPPGMGAKEWDAALGWASKQSKTAKLSLPDPVEGEEAASPKQLVYIRSLVQRIDETTLQTLTKSQASVLIEQILAQKKAFTKDMAEEYVHMHPQRRSFAPVLLLLGVVALIIVIFVALSR